VPRRPRAWARATTGLPYPRCHRVSVLVAVAPSHSRVAVPVVVVAVVEAVVEAVALVALMAAFPLIDD